MATKLPQLKGVEFADDAYDAARDAHALVIVTEWNEFRNLDLAKLKRLMTRPVLCDLRNIYDPEEVAASGLTHVGVGRGHMNHVAPKRRRARA
jgi:UDPglucose 6-dehydrogenase